MPRDYIPTTDAGLLAWSQNFSTLISATPVVFGLNAGNATSYAAAQSAYADALLAATEPSTRGGATVLAKRLARQSLVALSRQLARQVQGTMTVTDEQRYELGLTVRDAGPTPAPVPGATPRLDVVSVIGRNVKVRLHDAANPTRRGKPAFVAGASLFSYVGAVAPTDPAQYKFEGNTTRTTFDVVFPDTVASGATVYLCAFWYNAKAQSGPACTPVPVTIQGGAAVAA